MQPDSTLPLALPTLNPTVSAPDPSITEESRIDTQARGKCDIAERPIPIVVVESRGIIRKIAFHDVDKAIIIKIAECGSAR